MKTEKELDEYFYMKNLNYPYLTPIFYYTISLYNSLPAHTNSKS